MNPILIANTPGVEQTKNAETHIIPPQVIRRIEVPVDSPDGTYMAMLLDADDSFDMVVQYPDGEREIVWSICKERER